MNHKDLRMALGEHKKAWGIVLVLMTDQRSPWGEVLGHLLYPAYVHTLLPFCESKLVPLVEL